MRMLAWLKLVHAASETCHLSGSFGFALTAKLLVDAEIQMVRTVEHELGARGLMHLPQGVFQETAQLGSQEKLLLICTGKAALLMANAVLLLLLPLLAMLLLLLLLLWLSLLADLLELARLPA